MSMTPPSPPTIDERILDAALRVFEDVGLRGATTRRIAEEAGVNEVTLFRRFGSKESLLVEAMRRRQATAPRLLPDDPVDPAAELAHWCRAHAARLGRVRHLIRSSLTELEAHPQVCAAAHEEPRRVMAELVGYFERLVERGLAARGLDAHAAATMLMGAVFTEVVARHVLADPTPPSPDELALRYVPLLLRAIGAPPSTPAAPAGASR